MADWLLLQLADSAFPAGGFAHSGGLEAAVQLGEVPGTVDVAGFCRQAVWQAAWGGIPFLQAARAGAAAAAAADRRCHAFLVSHVARAASQRQGRALASTCAAAFAVKLELPHGHLAPTFGAAAAALGLGAEATRAAYLHLAARTVLSAAVRLGRVGPHQAQRVQRELAPVLEDALARSAGLSLDDAAQTAPVIDLVGAVHDRLYSRLFQS
jgi:urease accessory protein